MTASARNRWLVATLALSMGVMSFDQGSVGYLLPFIKPDLRLSNAQIGTAASLYWITFALASFAAGQLVGARRSIRRELITVLVAFAGLSALSAMVEGVASLLVMRAVMGAAAGALLTLSQSALGLCSPPDRVGPNMGLVTGLGGSLSGLVIAPVVLVQVASLAGWRTGYLAIMAPALLAGAMVARFVRDPDDAPSLATGEGRAILSGLMPLLRRRNIPLCALLCSLYVAYLGLGFTFLPIFLVDVRGYSVSQMSAFVVVLGLSSILFSITLPILADRIGRKPVLIVASATSVLTPLAAYLYDGPAPVLAVLLFLGWSITGTGSFSMGIIPSETVPGPALAKALGFVIALGVLMGGLLGPSIAGLAADRMGPSAPLLIQALCAVLATMVAFALSETAPRVVRRGRVDTAPSAS